MYTEKPALNPHSVNPWFIALTVTLATFMELLDTSIANVSLPYIGSGLGRSYDEVTWIPHDISCRQRGHLADVCMAESRLRQKELLPGLRRAFHADVSFLRSGA